MDISGIHPIDVILLVGYLVLITYIGKRSSRKIKSQEDFFLAGRDVGKLFQFFLNIEHHYRCGAGREHSSGGFCQGTRRRVDSAGSSVFRAY